MLVSPVLILSIVTSILTGIIFSIVLEEIFLWFKKRRRIKMMPDISQELLLASENKKVKKSDRAWLYTLIQKLHYAGIDLSIGYIFIILIVIDIVIGGLLYLFIPSSILFFFSTVITLFGFFQILDFLSYKRTKEFNRSLTTMITLLVRMMRNGVGFDQAMIRAVDVSSNPFFKGIMERFITQKQQIGEDKAFENLIESIDSKELRIFILAIRIGRQSGGAFSATLEKLELALQAREKLQRYIDTKTQESKMGSYFIATLIIVIFVVLDINFNGNVSKYFFHTLKGKIATLILIGWISTGIYLNTVMTRIKQ